MGGDWQLLTPIEGAVGWFSSSMANSYLPKTGNHWPSDFQPHSPAYTQLPQNDSELVLPCVPASAIPPLPPPLVATLALMLLRSSVLYLWVLESQLSTTFPSARL